MPENWSFANAAITDMQMRQRDVAALDAKYTADIDAKAENDALRDDVAAGRRRLHIVQSVSQASHHRLRRLMRAFSTGNTTMNPDYFTRADQYAKITGEPEVY